ncbi:hypothetical protein MBLNU13_g06872t1 [Cladosporium sp. NU13]
MPPSRMTRACKTCRRRKVKCDGQAVCVNCTSAGVPCEYEAPKKRGPRPASCSQQQRRTTPGATQPLDLPVLPSEPTAQSGRCSTLTPTIENTCGPQAVSAYLDSSSISSGLLPEWQDDTWAQLATTVHGKLLTGLRHSVSSEKPAWIVNHCILLYKQHVFGALPMCQESALRAAARRFFPVDLIGADASDVRAQIAHCFFASNESELIAALRSLTILTALCAAVNYVVPEQSLSNKHLTGPLFLGASRSLLKIYEDYDLEHADSSSMSIRLFHSTAIQSSTGSQQLAFHVLNEAGLIAMRMHLYDETSLQGLDPLEENLRRNAFWQLYVCDKTAMVMKGRPITIHEALFDTKLSLSTKSQNSISLFDHGDNSNEASDLAAFPYIAPVMDFNYPAKGHSTICQSGLNEKSSSSTGDSAASKRSRAAKFGVHLDKWALSLVVSLLQSRILHVDTYENWDYQRLFAA